KKGEDTRGWNKGKKELMKEDMRVKEEKYNELSRGKRTRKVKGKFPELGKKFPLIHRLML
ncbi:hypothetical protein RUM43_006398, partial [Polyplax serrata]